MGNPLIVLLVVVGVVIAILAMMGVFELLYRWGGRR